MWIRGGRGESGKQGRELRKEGRTRDRWRKYMKEKRRWAHKRDVTICDPTIAKDRQRYKEEAFVEEY